MPRSPAPEGPTARPRTVYAVSELNEILRALVEDALPGVWVQGEISNFSRPSSGHWYFTLKDQNASLRCAMFRNSNYYVRPQPRDGDSVLLRGGPSVYPARGELQLIVEHLEPAGVGALLRAFEELRNRLAAEGLFDAALKRPLPPLPRRLGIVTSGTGAALQDVLTALQRRWPLAEAVLLPVPVQGSEAPAAIVRALERLPRLVPVDLILLVRGGGSIEDLWSFNDERVARAIRACAVPVVCGVGHETDTTIADFAADLRAPTPTAAAELASPDWREWAARLEGVARHLERSWAQAQQRLDARLSRLALRLRMHDPLRRLQQGAQKLDELDLRLRAAQEQRLRWALHRLQVLALRLGARRPSAALIQARARLAALEPRLHAALRARLDGGWQRLDAAERLLLGLSPRQILERGYAIARDDQGRPLRDPAQLRTGEELRLELARGTLRARKL